MDDKEIKDLVKSSVKNALAEVELSNKLKELDELREANKKLTEKLVDKASSVENAEIPAEKVEELTEVVEKVLGDKVDSIVGEALAKVVERVDAIEESMTDKERVKKALSARRTPFKAMSRPAKAFTQGASNDGSELEAISEALENAKDKKDLEDIKNLLKAFVNSSKKVKLSAEEDSAELEAYRELGTIDEIETAVEVLETYAEEIGTLSEVKADDNEVEVEEDEVEVEEDEFSSKKARIRKALASKERRKLLKRKAMISRRKRLLEAKKRAMMVSKRKALIEKRKGVLASKKVTLSKRKALVERRRALASRRKEILKNKIRTNNSSRTQRIQELKEKRAKLATIKENIQRNLSPVVSSNNSNEAGALATALFSKKIW